MRKAVRFAPAIDTLDGAGHNVFVELSPHPVLGHSIRECLQRADGEATVLPSLRRDRPERQVMLGSLGALHTLRECPGRSPQPGEVSIEVSVTALNFRDVMKALG